MSVNRINHFRAGKGNSDRLLAFLRDQVRPVIAASSGCIDCQILQQADDPTCFIVLEVWHSTEAHKDSVAKIPPGMFAAIMPLLADKPSGFYYRNCLEPAAG